MCLFLVSNKKCVSVTHLTSFVIKTVLLYLIQVCFRHVVVYFFTHYLLHNPFTASDYEVPVDTTFDVR